MLLDDTKARNLLKCTTTRPQACVLQSVLRSRNHTIIRLWPLTAEDINVLFVKSTRQDNCRGLADIVLKRTGGNAMCVARFILLLCEKGLSKSDNKGRWEWMSSRIEAETETDGALTGVSLQETRQLPQETQEFLIYTTCLGSSTFNVNILQRVMCNVEMHASDETHPISKLKKSLEAAIRAGLVERAKTPGEYKIVHDQVRECLRDGLLPKGTELARLHKRIGENLLKVVEEESDNGEQNRLFLLAVHQMNHANIANSASSQTSLVRLAQMNAQAGELANVNGLFFTASTFCRCGLNLLPWRNAGGILSSCPQVDSSLW